MTLFLSSGEFTINPDAEMILDIADGKNWSVRILTNGRVYLNRIAAMAKAGNPPQLSISVDAGTRETFAKVKGVDYWETLVENIRKYHESGALILLKYILLKDINDNLSDIDGFFSLAREYGYSVAFVNNSKMLNERLMEKQMQAAKYFIQSAKDYGGGGVITFPNYFHEDDLKILRYT